MKRRSLLKSAAVLPAVAALTPAARAQSAPSAPASEHPKLELAPLDANAQTVTRFFTPPQLAALRKLGDLIVPKFNERPGAAEAGVAEFLDFYVSQSSAERQSLYRSGLDRLNAEARRTAGKTFDELTAEQASAIIKPVTDAWTYAGPADPFARFLVAAKDDLLRATMNSRAYATALAATSRGSSGLGYYWLPVE
jgi:hypothetical protein